MSSGTNALLSKISKSRYGLSILYYSTFLFGFLLTTCVFVILFQNLDLISIFSLFSIADQDVVLIWDQYEAFFQRLIDSLNLQILIGYFIILLLVTYFVRGGVTKKIDPFNEKQVELQQLKRLVEYFFLGSGVLPGVIIFGIPFFIQILMVLIIFVVFGSLVLLPYIILGEIYQVSKNRLIMLIREKNIILHEKIFLKRVFWESFIISLIFPGLILCSHFSGLDQSLPILYPILSQVIFPQNESFPLSISFWEIVNSVAAFLSVENQLVILIAEVIILTMISEIYLILKNLILTRYKKLSAYSPGWIYWNMGFVHRSKGEYHAAFDYSKKSYNYFLRKRDVKGQAQALALLVIVATDLEYSAEQNRYYQEIEDLESRMKKESITAISKLAKAYAHKASPRIIDKGKALETLMDLEVGYLDSTRLISFTLLNLIDLLIYEMKSSQNDQILGEIKAKIQEYGDFARTQKAAHHTIHAFIIESRFALIEGDVKRAQQLLLEAERFIKRRKSPDLLELITYEHYSLFFQLLEERDVFDESASIFDRLEFSNIEDVLLDSIDKQMEQLKGEDVASLFELKAFQNYLKNLSN